MSPVQAMALAGIAASAGFILYVLFGYPILLGWLSKRYANPVRRSPIQPTVSIIVAVHNGAAFLEQKLESIRALRYPRELVEIIIASDGSTDGTNEMGRQCSDVRLLELPRQGKPGALNAGIAEATGEILVLTDIRQRLGPESLSLLMENFADPRVGAASAELVILKGESSEEANLGLYWRYEAWIRARLSDLDSIFGASGAYYALRRELAVAIPTDALLDDMYLPLAAFFRHYRLILDSRAHMYDYPTGLESEFHRKVRTLAGNYQILSDYPALLGPDNRLWFHFCSYKLGRLLLPFALLAILVASCLLPSPASWYLLGAQALFYGIAAADLAVPEGGFKRLTSPARTFVVLMAATFCAPSIFFVPSSRLWKTSKISKR